MEKNSIWEFENNRVNLYISNKDYSESLRKIRIINSLSHIYPFVIIDAFIDTKEVIKDKIFGQEPINIKISLQDHTVEQEDISLELMYMQSNDIGMVIENMNSDDTQSNRAVHKFLTVCRKPYKTMTTLVNNVYENKTIRQIVENLTKNLKNQTNIEMTNRGENTEKLDQVLIPPLPYNKSLQYIDQTFGFYNGPMSSFCRHDNTVCIKNLSAQMKEKSKLIIYYLASDSPNTKKIMDKCSDGVNFYSPYPVTSKYIGNSKFAIIAPNLHFIVKPTDKLYSEINIDMLDLSKENGLTSIERPVLYDPAIDREKYITDHTGYSRDNRDNNLFAISSLSKEISSLSSINLSLSGKLLLKNLLEPGVTVEFIPETLDYTPLSGRYVLKASDIVIRQVKSKEWRTSANLYLIRTNKLSG